MFFCSTPAQTCEYDVFTSVQQLSPEWNAFLPEGHRLKTTELQVAEHSATADLRFAYLLIRRKSVLLGLAAFQIVEIKSSHFPSSAWKSGFFQHMKEVVFCKPRYLLVCGNVFRNNGPAFYFKNKENDALIFDLMRHFDRQNPFRFRFFGLWVKEPPSSMNVDSGFTPVQGDLLMQMSLRPEWETLDDYFASLSKKYLQRARKIRKALEGIDVRTLSEPEVSGYSEELGRLFGQVLDQQAFHLSSLPGTFFVEMKKALGDRFQITGYFKENKLVAFSSHLFCPDNSLEIYYIGLDYEANESHKLYFNLMFDGLESAILERKEILKLGRTGLDAKASLGAEPVPVTHFVRLKRGLATLVFRSALSWYQSQEKPGWKERNPLISKQQPEAEMVSPV